MKRIAVFASGSGSNAENLAKYFNQSKLAVVHVIVTDNKNAGVIERARKLNVTSRFFSDAEFKSSLVLKYLQNESIDFIVLAGFLKLVPETIINAFNNRIINIHPALLPKHGGKGYYGSRVHRSVIESGSIMSGITIHRVDEKYDNGEIVFQAACHVGKNETPESLALKIHTLEYAYLPVVIEKLLRGLPA